MIRSRKYEGEKWIQHLFIQKGKAEMMETNRNHESNRVEQNKSKADEEIRGFHRPNSAGEDEHDALHSNLWQEVVYACKHRSVPSLIERPQPGQNVVNDIRLAWGMPLGVGKLPFCEIVGIYRSGRVREIDILWSEEDKCLFNITRNFFHWLKGDI